MNFLQKKTEHLSKGDNMATKKSNRLLDSSGYVEARPARAKISAGSMSKKSSVKITKPAEKAQFVSSNSKATEKVKSAPGLLRAGMSKKTAKTGDTPIGKAVAKKIISTAKSVAKGAKTIASSSTVKEHQKNLAEMSGNTAARKASNPKKPSTDKVGSAYGTATNKARKSFGLKSQSSKGSKY